MLKRIHRTSAWPVAVREELPLRGRYPLTGTITHKGKVLALSYRRTRRFKLEPEELVRHRELFCWIAVDGQEQAGALRFDEWEADPLIGDDEFYDHLDSYSFAAVQLAKAILSCWQAHDLTDYGPIAEFSVAWMRPAHAQEGLWAAAARHLIDKHFARTHSALILKSFPLEYEGNAPQGSPKPLGLVHRQLAACRLFRRELGVEKLPGAAGAGGWMWKPLRGVHEQTAPVLGSEVESDHPR